MSLPKYSDLKDLITIADIEQEVFIIQKNLFDLRIKQATNQTVKSHLFKHAKRRLAQLKLKKNTLSISTN